MTTYFDILNYLGVRVGRSSDNLHQVVSVHLQLRFTDDRSFLRWRGMWDTHVCVEGFPRRWSPEPSMDLLSEPVDKREFVTVGDAVENVLHVFCECCTVALVWGWMRQTVLRFLPSDWGCLSDLEILYLSWPSSQYDVTIVWLLSQYVQYVWTHYRESRGSNALGRILFFYPLEFQPSSGKI